MMNGSPLVFVGVAPHPPIMVPEVGGAHTAEVGFEDICVD